MRWIFSERRPWPLGDRLWFVLKGAQRWGLDTCDGEGRTLKFEDGLEQSEDGLYGPQAKRQYYEHRLSTDELLIKRYLDGEASLHLHLRGLPLKGEGSLKAPTADFCAIYQRQHGDAPTDLFELGGPRLGSDQTPDYRGACPCGMHNSVLVNDVETGELPKPHSQMVCREPQFDRSPDGYVETIVGLQLLQACQVAAEIDLLSRLNHARRAVKLSGVIVDREL